MPAATATDVAYIRYSVPDLARSADFLGDFGLIRLAPHGDPGILRFRGYGTAPFVCELREGEAGFDGYGLKLGTEAELVALAGRSGRPIERIEGPGGGWRVRLTDPDGMRVDAVFGQAEAAPLARPETVSWNAVKRAGRPGATKRLLRGAAHVVRLGHVVMLVKDVSHTLNWLVDWFGFLVSDLIKTDDGTAVAAFIRCDRGDTLTDHHSLNIAAVPDGRTGFHHAAFEVLDLDDLLLGRDHLLSNGHESVWGVGRHLLGSQVFDYWRDPGGIIVEHWTDGDVFTASEPTQIGTLADMTGVQWGPSMAPGFV